MKRKESIARLALDDMKPVLQEAMEEVVEEFGPSEGAQVDKDIELMSRRIQRG